MKIVEGDLLDMFEDNQFDAIFHQANTLGSMGAGIAYQIRERFPLAYYDYTKHCYRNKDTGELLGTFVRTYYDCGVLVSLLGQDRVGHGLCTSYDHLYKSMSDFLAAGSPVPIHKVGVPCYMGCGLGGGEWHVVTELLEKIENEFGVEVTAVRLPNT